MHSKNFENNKLIKLQENEEDFITKCMMRVRYCHMTLNFTDRTQPQLSCLGPGANLQRKRKTKLLKQ